MRSRKNDGPSVSDIPGFPYGSFAELQQAAARKKANIGVDPLAAAEWSDAHATGVARIAVPFLSVLLVAAGSAALIVALLTHDYLLIAPIPAMAIAFYFSNPGYKYHKQVTVAVAAVVRRVFCTLVNRVCAPRDRPPRSCLAF